MRRRPGPVLEHGREPVHGLPEPLPLGETILWQGSPDFRALARRAFHVRAVLVYFTALAGWRLLSGVADGADPLAVAMDALGLAVPAGSALGLLLLFAWLYARSTVFTVTNRRVVMRFGVALPMAINLPFGAIAEARLKLYADGTGDLPLALGGPDRIAWLHLWPFVRPWRAGRPEPMLRAISNGAEVARILTRALEQGRERTSAREPGTTAARSTEASRTLPAAA